MKSAKLAAAVGILSLLCCTAVWGQSYHNGLWSGYNCNCKDGQFYQTSLLNRSALSHGKGCGCDRHACDSKSRCGPSKCGAPKCGLQKSHAKSSCASKASSKCGCDRGRRPLLPALIGGVDRAINGFLDCPFGLCKLPARGCCDKGRSKPSVSKGCGCGTVSQKPHCSRSLGAKKGCGCDSGKGPKPYYKAPSQSIPRPLADPFRDDPDDRPLPSPDEAAQAYPDVRAPHSSYRSTGGAVRTTSGLKSTPPASLQQVVGSGLRVTKTSFSQPVENVVAQPPRLLTEPLQISTRLQRPADEAAPAAAKAYPVNPLRN